MKNFMAGIFYRLLSSIGTANASKLLWNGLSRNIGNTYQPGGEGEEFVLGTLAEIHKFECAIDTGANIGSWSALMLKLSPDCKIMQ